MSAALRSEQLLIPEKEVNRPVIPLRDRSFISFEAETLSQNLNSFEFLNFKVDVPSSQSVLKNIDIVLPIRFRFYNRAGKTQHRPGIAIKADGLDQMFKNVRVGFNGQNFQEYPLNKMIHKWVSPGKGYDTKSDHSLLPVLPSSDVALSMPNESFESRCQYFASKAASTVKRVTVPAHTVTWNGHDTAVTATTHTEVDNYYDCSLHVALDAGPLSAWYRGQLGQSNGALPYAFQLDIGLSFNNKQGSRDASSAVQGQAWCKYAFDIQQPLSKLPLERRGIVPKVTTTVHNDSNNVPGKNFNVLKYEVSTSVGANLPTGNPNEDRIPVGRSHILGIRAMLRASQEQTNTVFARSINDLGGNPKRKFYVCFARTQPTRADPPLDNVQWSPDALFSNPRAEGAAPAVPGYQQQFLRLGAGGANGRFFIALTSTSLGGSANEYDVGHYITVASDLEQVHVHGTIYDQGYRLVVFAAPLMNDDLGPFELWHNYISANIQYKGKKQSKLLYSFPGTNAARQDFFSIFNDRNHQRFFFLTNELDVAGRGNRPTFHAHAGAHAIYVHNETAVTAIPSQQYFPNHTNRLWDAVAAMVFGEVEIRYPNAVGGPIKACGTAYDRRKGRNRFSLRLSDEENQALDGRDFALMCERPDLKLPCTDHWETRTPFAVVGASVQDVNFNGVYTNETTPNGVSCSYEEASQGLTGRYPLLLSANGDTANQIDFVGGKCMVIPYKEEDPIVAIGAEWRPNVVPYVHCEVIYNPALKDRYLLDDYRIEYYDYNESQLTVGDLAGTQKIIRFNDIRVQEAWSKMYLYAQVHEDDWDTELTVGGLSDLLFDVGRMRLQINEKTIWDFTGKENDRFLYRCFSRACPNSGLNYDQWKTRRMICAWNPEEMTVGSLQESRFQISNINLQVWPKLGAAWEKIMERYGTVRTNLSTKASDAALTSTDLKKKMQYTNPAEFKKYLEGLRVTFKLVLEYSNYALQLSSDGSVSKILNRLPSIGKSGYELAKVQPPKYTGIQRMRTRGFVFDKMKA